MQLHIHREKPAAFSLLQRVRGLTEIEFLVKESEVLTGCAGRVFVISGADHLAYRVRWHPAIVEVERLDADGTVLDTQHLPPSDFATHSVVEALVAGQLYTEPVRTAH